MAWLLQVRPASVIFHFSKKRLWNTIPYLPSSDGDLIWSNVRFRSRWDFHEFPGRSPKTLTAPLPTACRLTTARSSVAPACGAGLPHNSVIRPQPCLQAAALWQAIVL